MSFETKIVLILIVGSRVSFEAEVVFRLIVGCWGMGVLLSRGCFFWGLIVGW